MMSGGLPETFCHSSRTSRSIVMEGTAQAYKPTPHQSQLSVMLKIIHFWRLQGCDLAPISVHRENAPSVVLKITFGLLRPSYAYKDSTCCCKPMAQDKDAAIKWWKYGRLDLTGRIPHMGGQQEGDCRGQFVRRATVPPRWSLRQFAPGSTGGLGGLGPSSWISCPYGPPSIHFLVTSRLVVCGDADRYPCSLGYQDIERSVIFVGPTGGNKAWTKFSEQSTL
jgi:hypothetical protein